MTQLSAGAREYREGVGGVPKRYEDENQWVEARKLLVCASRLNLSPFVDPRRPLSPVYGWRELNNEFLSFVHN